MSARDENPDVRIPDEPEDEKAFGTVEEAGFESNGLAADPYADDMPFRPARPGVSRWLLAGIIVALILAALALIVVIRARGL